MEKSYHHGNLKEELIKKGIKDITYIGIAFYKKQLRISYK